MSKTVWYVYVRRTYLTANWCKHSFFDASVQRLCVCKYCSAGQSVQLDRASGMILGQYDY